MSVLWLLNYFPSSIKHFNINVISHSVCINDTKTSICAIKESIVKVSLEFETTSWYSGLLLQDHHSIETGQYLGNLLLIRAEFAKAFHPKTPHIQWIQEIFVMLTTILILHDAWDWEEFANFVLFCSVLPCFLFSSYSPFLFLWKKMFSWKIS